MGLVCDGGQWRWRWRGAACLASLPPRSLAGLLIVDWLGPIICSLAPLSSPLTFQPMPLHTCPACCPSPALAPPLQVVKAASGKFHPLFQWFYFDSIESLPEEVLSAEEVAPLVGGWNGAAGGLGGRAAWTML